jgi:hypothetical protein
MNEFKFSCPHCQQSIEATPEYAGVQINCPSCQAEIVVPKTPTAPVPRPGKLTKVASTVQYGATTPKIATALARKNKKPRVGLYVGLGVGAVVAVAAIFFVPKLLDKYHQHQEAVAAAEAAAKNPPPPPPPPDLAADEILQKVGATYKKLTSYSVQGISIGTVDRSQISPAMKEPQTVTTKLSLRLGRPDLYRMEWEREVGKQQIKGAVWAAGKGDFVHPGAVTAKVKDRETALNTAAASSDTLGVFIAALFFDETNSPAATLKNYAKTNNETLNGQKCYVLTGQIVSQKVLSQNVLFWVHKSDFLIAQTELILGGKIDEAALAGLSLVQKAQMEKASKLKGNYIETYQDIVTNKVLNPGDFETSFPPNATPQPKQQREPRRPRPGTGGAMSQ